MTDDYCNDSPAGAAWPVCHLVAGHDGRHESADMWWSERQQAPCLKGHIHSTELFCTSVCPSHPDYDREWAPPGR